MASSRIQGQCASPGFAEGIVAAPVVQGERRRGKGDIASESAALEAAIARAADELRALEASAEGEAADMIAFQIAMLEDETLAEEAFVAIAAERPAEAAWTAALAGEIAGYEASDEEYFRARASDLVDIRDRVLDALTGASAVALQPGSIVLADDITPSRFLGVDWEGGAILLRKGSATSHVAMLARARGVPMIVGLAANDILGRNVLVDAGGGTILVDPTPEEEALFRRDRDSGRMRTAAAAAYLTGPAMSADGTRIAALINVADPAELEGLDPAICDGIGLVRTELLFEGRPLPSEDEQFAVFARIVNWAAGRPVTFRTLDAGGDKPIAGLTPTDESNPFLGVRGVRLTLLRKDVFLPQLRALARAAALGPVEVMIPMVSVPRELEACRRLLDEACAGLAQEHVAYRQPALGMMVEVPAAALTLEDFDAAFLSIGSNDLTQYVMAAGRDIAAVADLADAAHPAVLKLIGLIADHGARRGIKVSLCGDAGGDERLIPLLLGQGLRALSMPPRLLAGAKMAIAQVDLAAPGAGHG